MMKDRRTRRRIILAAPLGAALLTARVAAPALAQGQQPPGKSTPAPTSGSGSAPSAGSAGLAGRVDAHLRQLAARRPKDTIAVLVHRTKKGKSVGLDAVKAHGGRIKGELSLANIVAADVPAERLEALARTPGITRVSYDAPMQMQGSGTLSARQLKTVYPIALRAAELWSEATPIQGTGVGVAILDSGTLDIHKVLSQCDRKGVCDYHHSDFRGTAPDGRGPGVSRIMGGATLYDWAPAGVYWGAAPNAYDDNGHGTWVAGMVGGRGWGAETGADDGSYVGIAPDVNLISVKVSDESGRASLFTVVRGIEWVMQNRVRLNVRVINLSLLSTVAESYLTNPLNAAVELAWLQGVLVMVSAGNGGPDTMRYAPANDPYVITVGATDDAGTVSTADDRLAWFSSYGTTQDGFAKPELVAPGRRVTSVLSSMTAPLVSGLTDRVTADKLYVRFSGTSASAPMISGVAALVLQAKPALTPDQVKWLLTRTALPIPGAGTGAGYPQAAPAVRYTGVLDRANRGLTPNRYLQEAYASQNGLAAWDTVAWDTVAWDTVAWDTVAWDTMNWGSVLGD